MIIILFLIGFVALMMAIGLVCTEKAPVAYEDETGFHFGYPNVREGRIFGILIIPAAKKSSDQSAEEKVIPLFPSRVPWLHKGIGIAAVFIGLLVLLPEKFQNVENPRGLNIQMGNSELAFNDAQRANVPAAQIEPSRFNQVLCLRFSRAE